MDWKNVGCEILEKVCEALDYWCWNISEDSVLDCYCTHMDMDLYDLALGFINWSTFDITDEDLKILEEMPYEIYIELNDELQTKIENVIKKLENENKFEEDIE